LLTGCGKNNILQGLTKPEENEDLLAMAQMYLDEGKYTKAENITRDLLSDRNSSDDNDASIILGQALMGRGGLDVNGVLKNLTLDNPTSTSNFALLNIVPLSKRPHIYEAANVLLSVDTSDREVLLAASIASMCAAVLMINSIFDPSGGTIGDGQGTEPIGTATINATWNTVSASITAWTLGSINLMVQATNDQDLINAAASINAQVSTVNTQVAAGNVTYDQLLSDLGF
ncbi:MAG: hypothetical protein KKA19_07060, partial [Candidatus Margulisbacteria bacterium]|nr:hypothetical protein [Candidatus Margulisiibacteriota bacterium]